MTYQKVCEEWVRFLGAEEKDVPTKAKQFFDLSPTGELLHVFEAYDILRFLGKI
jgi:hypothetical protein